MHYNYTSNDFNATGLKLSFQVVGISDFTEGTNDKDSGSKNNITAFKTYSGLSTNSENGTAGSKGTGILNKPTNVSQP